MSHLKVVALLLAVLLLAPQPVHSNPMVVREAWKQVMPRLLEAAKTVGSVLGAYITGKFLDVVTGLDFRVQLDQQIRELEGQVSVMVNSVAKTAGEERKLLEEQLDAVHEQLELMQRVAEATRADVALLRSQQERLKSRFERLSSRVDQLEGRVGTLEDEMAQVYERLARLEAAQIRDCVDHLDSRAVGTEGYRVFESGNRLLVDQGLGPGVSLSLRIHLDACTGTLTERGMLIQLAFLTRGLRDELALHSTYKHLGTGSYDSVYMNQLQRQEYFLGRPDYELDGQVREIFVPYAEMPFPSYGDRMALALVFTHDGQPLYSLADRVIHCNFGQRVTCRFR